MVEEIVEGLRGVIRKGSGEVRKGEAKKTRWRETEKKGGPCWRSRALNAEIMG